MLKTVLLRWWNDLGQVGDRKKVKMTAFRRLDEKETNRTVSEFTRAAYAAGEAPYSLKIDRAVFTTRIQNRDLVVVGPDGRTVLYDPRHKREFAAFVAAEERGFQEEEEVENANNNN